MSLVIHVRLVLGSRFVPFICSTVVTLLVIFLEYFTCIMADYLITRLGICLVVLVVLCCA